MTHDSRIGPSFAETANTRTARRHTSTQSQPSHQRAERFHAFAFHRRAPLSVSTESASRPPFCRNSAASRQPK